MTDAPILWRPSPERMANSHLSRFLAWLTDQGQHFGDYEELWEWSTAHPEKFWDAIWHYFALPGRGDGPVLANSHMPGASWFEGSQSNYVGQLFERFSDHETMLVGLNEQGRRDEWSRAAVAGAVGALQGQLARWSISASDRVAAFLPNIAQTAGGGRAGGDMVGLFARFWCCECD